jgi:hypothetical protein
MKTSFAGKMFDAFSLPLSTSRTRQGLLKQARRRGFWELLPLVGQIGKAIRTRNIYCNWVMYNTILCG